MSRVAIIGGTGFEKIGGVFTPEVVETRFGQALVYRGQGDLDHFVFLSRHGVDHTIPPHRINYRANIMALKKLEVDRALATYAVGSLRLDIAPMAMVLVDQFMDFTYGRECTFFDGGKSGLAHTEMSDPYCPVLRQQVLTKAAERGMKLLPHGNYVATNGPRLETAAEVRMFAQLGGDVVGMTGVPEAPLCREMGIHFAAVAFSINYGAGLTGPIKFEEAGQDELRQALTELFMDVLNTPMDFNCGCQTSTWISHPPEEN
jgi:5'-methylthioadenosine phosphorylase